jgi:translocation and assembly module TamB
VAGSLRTDSLDLAMLQLLGDRVTRMHGRLNADIDVAGTWRAPILNGAVTLDDGSVFVPAIGGRYSNLVADIALSGDTIRVRRLSAETNADRRGALSVEGTVVLNQSEPVFALRAQANNFRAIDQRGLASLDVSTSRPITLMGPYDHAVVEGGVLVNRGSVYIPELIRKRVVDLNDPELYDVIDSAEIVNRALLPETPIEFARNLRLENVDVSIGDDVWLRSDEANIKLGGSLSVTMGSTNGEAQSQLALQGVLRAVRGTYRLNIVPLVQPTFDVESGTLRFFGTPGLDPALNITAINTVRKPAQSVNHQDVRIRATIAGTLSSPTLTLSSADNLPLTQSDLLSYLITGEPAFALDYNSQTYVDQLAAVAIRSAGNVISSAIPRSVFDVVELQTAGARDPNSAARVENPTLYNLLNTRAVLGKQLNNNLFLNFSTGFCAENFRNNLGFRLEYRLGQTYRVLFGLEPGSSELTCSRSSAVQSIQQTPPQFGFDFFRNWRF